MDYEEKRKTLRIGDSARAHFFRMKDEFLGENLMAAMQADLFKALSGYSTSRFVGESRDPNPDFVLDPDGEAVNRGFELLNSIMRHLMVHEDDWEALRWGKECIVLIKEHAQSFIPRGLVLEAKHIEYWRKKRESMGLKF